MIYVQFSNAKNSADESEKTVSHTAPADCAKRARANLYRAIDNIDWYLQQTNSEHLLLHIELYVVWSLLNHGTMLCVWMQWETGRHQTKPIWFPKRRKLKKSLVHSNCTTKFQAYTAFSCVACIFWIKKK